MANNVRFLRGTSVGFAAIAQKDENTFYYLTDKAELYLGANKIGGANLDELRDSIGDLDTLKTTDKENLVKAINEIFDKVSAAGVDYTVTLEKDSTGSVYKLRQGEASAENPDSNLIGTINIPKDIVVKSCQVVTNPAGQPAGKYIELVINTDDGENSLYLNVADLVEPYSAAENAAQVQVAISEGNVISATIVEGSIDTKDLADGSVTKVKLAQEVQDAIEALAWGTF